MVLHNLLFSFNSTNKTVTNIHKKKGKSKVKQFYSYAKKSRNILCLIKDIVRQCAKGITRK